MRFSGKSIRAMPLIFFHGSARSTNPICKVSSHGRKRLENSSWNESSSPEQRNFTSTPNKMTTSLTPCWDRYRRRKMCRKTPLFSCSKILSVVIRQSVSGHCIGPKLKLTYFTLCRQHCLLGTWMHCPMSGSWQEDPRGSRPCHREWKEENLSSWHRELALYRRNDLRDPQIFIIADNSTRSNREFSNLRLWSSQGYNCLH